jgi:DMSO/TMAO reductase YedYZ molybdopterin-dependent catalytic subunit
MPDIVSPGFFGRRRAAEPSGTPAAPPKLPPGQYLERGFPVLSAGPTPRVKLDTWEFRLVTEQNQTHSWDWKALKALPVEDITVDIHCVTKWSKFGTHWQGVSVDSLLDGIETTAEYALVRSFGGYTTNLPLADLRGGRAWVVFGYDGKDLAAEHGGPARLLVPHLYFWKSAKWVRGIDLRRTEEQGFWEQLGYHDYGDPWREQRYSGD